MMMNRTNPDRVTGMRDEFKYFMRTRRHTNSLSHVLPLDLFYVRPEIANIYNSLVLQFLSTSIRVGKGIDRNQLPLSGYPAA
jgi:hypothetical protein